MFNKFNANKDFLLQSTELRDLLQHYLDFKLDANDVKVLEEYMQQRFQRYSLKKPEFYELCETVFKHQPSKPAAD